MLDKNLSTVDMKNDTKRIVAVNGTALSKSGALTILKQFIKHAAKDDKYQYLCFIPENLELECSENITLIEIPKMSWVGRILWDAFKFKKYLNTQSINPYKVISLQNTSINVNVDQIIYLHQPLPFSSIKWSVYKKEQFKLFLYKHFYSFFIFLFVNKNTNFVVQTNWMKEALCAISLIDESKVHVIKPDINLPTVTLNNMENKNKSEYILLYPATPIFYKNHLIILEALKLLKEKGQVDNVKLQVTFEEDDYILFSKQVKKFDLSNNVEFLGTRPYEEMTNIYQRADIILFPSYVETFGLPLVEGASLGKPVLCSDLPFSRDVLAGYSGATFLNYQDPIEWANMINDTLLKVQNGCFEYGVFESTQTTTWKDFFELV
ncbi:glycosyltransferase [Shewanella frigidimarina]|uniref:glycosyltransferase n=1 Tax=Shewanella frigidimarina TaxID=56812 RepID=UPI003D78FAC7